MNTTHIEITWQAVKLELSPRLARICASSSPLLDSKPQRWASVECAFPCRNIHYFLRNYSMWKNELWMVGNQRVCKHFRGETVKENAQKSCFEMRGMLAKFQC